MNMRDFYPNQLDQLSILFATDGETLSQEQDVSVSETCHPERSRRMTTARQWLSHGSTPLTMTLMPLHTARVDLMGQPLSTCRF